jgi:hypothetical protein
MDWVFIGVHATGTLGLVLLLMSLNLDFGDRCLLSAAIALPAWCSSQKPMTALDNTASRHADQLLIHKFD